MAVVSPNIDPADLVLITNAHKQLLDGRAKMIAGFAKVEASSYRAGIFADALITGIVGHLQEVAKGKVRFATEIQQFGGSFGGYANTLVGECVSVFASLR